MINKKANPVNNVMFENEDNALFYPTQTQPPPEQITNVITASANVTAINPTSSSLMMFPDSSEPTSLSLN